jgi:lysophospholipase L1-like esterase
MRVALCVFSVLATLVCSEAALRIYHAATNHSQAQARPVPLHIVTDEPYLYGLNPQHPDISPQGTRDDAVVIPKPPGVLRILVLGDSIPFGATVSKNETFPNRMEQQLRTEFGPVDVINSGVMGYSPYNELQYYLTRGKTFDADIVVVAFCMNDVVNPRLHWGDAPGVKIPDEAIPNLDYDRTQILPKIQQLEEERRRSANGEGGPGRLLRKSELYQAFDKAKTYLFQKKARYYPVNNSGIPTFITTEDTLSIEVLLDRNTPEWRWLASMYDRLAKAVAADGAKLVIAIFPLAYQLDPNYPFLPQSQILDYCKEKSLPCLDLLPSFRQHPKEDIFLLDQEKFYDIWHLTKYGHELSAAEIVSFLRERQLLPVKKELQK